MGYFASLARQTGIVPTSAAGPVQSIEMDVTRIAEVPAFTAPASPRLETAASPFTPPAPAPHTATPTMSAPQAAREIVIEVLAPPRFEIREHVLEVATVAERPTAPPRDPAPPMPIVLAEAPTAPPAAVVCVGEPEPAQPPPHERRRPTLADVRAWVAQPVLAAAKPPAGEPALRPPAAVRAAEAPPPTLDRAENYTLEIGTIQIVMESPAAATPPRPSPPPQSGPPAQASTHPSRYYLRP